MKKYNLWTSLAIFTVLIGTSELVRASEDILSKITGNRISLIERNHSFAGEIAEIPVFGVFEESLFEAKVELRRNGKTLVLNLTQNERQYAGDIKETQTTESGGETREITTHIELNTIKKTGPHEGQIILKIDGQDVTVKVSAHSFENGHFQAPHFEATINGRTISFVFSGQACFGYSVNIAMMILGPYAHLVK